METDADRLRGVVERQHACTAVLVYVSHVRIFEGPMLWEGPVHVFELKGHPKATTAYAWSAATDGTHRKGDQTALDLDGFTGPVDAVRSAHRPRA
jgi:hypothetical protein